MKTPRKNWSVQQLKEFVLSTTKRHSIDRYWMGMALCWIQEQTDYGDWVKTQAAILPELSYATTHRWMQFARKVDEQGIKLTDAEALNKLYWGICNPPRKGKKPSPHKPPVITLAASLARAFDALPDDHRFEDNKEQQLAALFRKLMKRLESALSALDPSKRKKAA